MRAYLQRVWALLSPYRGESTPLMAQHHDLESYGHTPSDTILLVCEPPDPPALAHPSPGQHLHPHTHSPLSTHTHSLLSTHTHSPPPLSTHTHSPPPQHIPASPFPTRTRTHTHTRISPFSEDHFPRLPPSPTSSTLSV
jgi:hypothetical protein